MRTDIEIKFHFNCFSIARSYSLCLFQWMPSSRTTLFNCTLFSWCGVCQTVLL